MPAPYIGHISPELQELNERLLRLQVAQAERSFEQEGMARPAAGGAPGGGIEAAMQTAGQAAEQTAFLQEQLAATEREQKRTWEWKEEEARAKGEAAERKALAPQYGKIKTGEGREAWIMFDPVTQQTTEIYKAPEPPFSTGGDQLVMQRNEATGRYEPIWIPRIKLAAGERLVEEMMGTTMAPAEQTYETETALITLSGGQLVNIVPKMEIPDDEFIKVTPDGMIEFYRKDDPETVIRQVLPEDFGKGTMADMIKALAAQEAVRIPVEVKEIEVKSAEQIEKEKRAVEREGIAAGLKKTEDTLKLRAREAGISETNAETARFKAEGEVAHMVRSDTLAENQSEWQKDIAYLNQHNNSLLARIRELEVMGTLAATMEANRLKKVVAANNFKLGMLNHKLEYAKHEEATKQNWYSLAQQDKIILIDERIAKVDERYKMGVLSVDEKDLVRRTRLDESTIALEDRRLDQAELAQEALNSWKAAEQSIGVQKITHMNSVLEFEKEKFTATHEYNAGQDNFLNDLLERAEDRADKEQALRTAVSHWDRTRNDAYLDLAQLKEQQQDLLGWAEVARATKADREATRLEEQAQEISLTIAGYEREIKLIDARLDQSKFNLLQWEKIQTVPVAVLEAQARMEEIEATIEEMGRPELIKLGPRERGFMLRPGEEVPTAVPGMEPLPEVAEQKNIMAELMGKAVAATPVTAGLALDEDTRLLRLDYFKAFVRADERLDELRKTYYIGMADDLAGRAPKLSDMLREEQPTGIPWTPGSLTWEQFLREWNAADVRRKGGGPATKPAAKPKATKTKKLPTELTPAITKFIDDYKRDNPEWTAEELTEAVRRKFGE